MTLHKKQELYKSLVEKIFSRCQQIQAENERCVMRVNGIKKILRRRTHDLVLLKKKLDKHGDDWRSIPMMGPQPKGKPEQKRRGPKPKSKQTMTDVTSETTCKPRKQRVKKQPSDANATTAHHAIQLQQLSTV
ncbi:TCF3 fusion partner homolog [Drosophila montana]|uniref:TCF3 fusion partner homolog n=1 Tax=Drosophila montana TaxID=40370 RepID=UPI00313B7AEC